MNQFVVMSDWKEWLIERGLPEWQASWFVSKGYAWCKFIEESAKC